MDINYMDFYSYPARFPGPQLPAGPPRPPGGLPTPNPQQAPTSPPPAFIPAQQTATPFAVDPEPFLYVYSATRSYGLETALASGIFLFL